ncbi:MAG: 4Fe-4S dicluster domain-containing protein [Methanoregula sp.]|jgi:NAD-dependent dihydropyrimidine dehydrogenase PreA subunit|nr:4Fe-4S dicluster domain-containing protein [Methanoregula sp.]
MKRKIINIDETKCTGCGQCIPDCPEGALQIIDNKARLVSDLFCDGLGACIGTCPEGAISVIEREAAPYSEAAVMETIIRQGAPVIKAHLEHLLGHGERGLYNEAIEYLLEHSMQIPDHDNSSVLKKPVSAGQKTQPPQDRPATCPPGPDQKHPFAGCPGSAARSMARPPGAGPRQPAGTTGSELRQWPVQLALLNPGAGYFDDADLLVSADCAPFAYAGFHADLLAGKILVIFCPKLDADIEGYINKLAEIFGLHAIKSVTVVRMEVPCCGGVRYVVDKALEKSGKNIPVVEKIVTINGEIR